MGNRFMSGLYVIHDNEDPLAPRMGFAPIANSYKSALEKTTKPVAMAQDVMWEITWIGLYANIETGFLMDLFKFFSDLWIMAFGVYPG
jgi:hypothetical protein